MKQRGRGRVQAERDSGVMETLKGLVGGKIKANGRETARTLQTWWMRDVAREGVR